MEMGGKEAWKGRGKSCAREEDGVRGCERQRRGKTKKQSGVEDLPEVLFCHI